MLYGKNVGLSGKTDGLSIADSNLWTQLGSTEGTYFWTSDEYSATTCYFRSFSSNLTEGNNNGGRQYGAAYGNYKFFCVDF